MTGASVSGSRGRAALRSVLCAAALAGALAASAEPSRVEVQVGLCGDPAAIERALGLRPRAAPYETWLFDDPSLTLFERGIRVRLRMLRKHAELTLKVANQDCEALPVGSLPRGQGKCEYDAHGATIAGAVSLTHTLDLATARALAVRSQPVADVLSPAQLRYLRDVLHIDPLPAALRPLGPIANRVFETADGEYDVDVSTLPGGERFAEISTRVARRKAKAAGDRLDARLAQAGVTACADQSGQAATKLRLLAAQP